MNKRASITIETAISFSVVMIFMAVVINALNIFYVDIVMQRSLRRVCEEMSLITPLSVSSSDMINTFITLVPDDANTDEQVITDEDINYLKTNTGNLGKLTVSVFDLAFSHTFESTVLDYYCDYTDLPIYEPDDIAVDFHIDDKSSVVIVDMTYKVNTIGGPISRNVVDIIPFYGDFEYFAKYGKNVLDGDIDNFWQLGNFERGEWLRNNYPCNLPATFPVINNFDHGMAVSYTSINLNSKSYEDEKRIRTRIEDEISDMSSFNGANVMINGQNYVIEENEIMLKRIVIIIPENSPESSVEILNEYKAEQAENGIDIQIVFMGNS